MDRTLRVQCNTWLIVSSNNIADKSSEETERYLPLVHHKYITFPIATIPPMSPDLGVEAPRRGTMDIKLLPYHANRLGFMRGGRPGPEFPSGPMPRQQQLGGPGVRGSCVCRYFPAGE